MNSIILKLVKCLNYLIKFFKAVLKIIISYNFSIAIISLLVYYTSNLLNQEHGNSIHFSEYFIYVLLTIFKCILFTKFSLERIAETNLLNKSFNWFMLKFTSLYFLVIISFATDFWILFQIDSSNFKNIEIGNILEQSFDFFYYSFMTITTVGFGEIQAVSRIAKLYTILEVFMGFVFIAYILSCFNFVREEFKKR